LGNPKTVAEKGQLSFQERLGEPGLGLPEKLLGRKNMVYAYEHTAGRGEPTYLPDKKRGGLRRKVNALAQSCAKRGKDGRPVKWGGR